MTQSRSIRIFLAVYLAIWSPLWCCCTAQATLLEVSQGSGQDLVETTNAPTTVRSCCMGATGESSASPCSFSEDGESTDSSNHDQEDCECGNHFVEMAPQTVVTLDMPWQLGIDALQPLLTANLESQLDSIEIDLLLIQTDDRLPGGTARTLYAQHALLLV
ncbi:MAG: hypothetical protein O7G85_10995 [Planctomycetota bacterium]|nr:hypothetical protein [Planctomycetota bacterium]